MRSSFLAVMCDSGQARNRIAPCAFCFRHAPLQLRNRAIKFAGACPLYRQIFSNTEKHLALVKKAPLWLRDCSSSIIQKSVQEPEIVVRQWGSTLNSANTQPYCSIPPASRPSSTCCDDSTNTAKLTSLEVDLNLLSPMMAHYVETKRKYPNYVLLYRVGDFFEAFFEDAICFAETCDLALTSKDAGKALGARVPMAGIPYHTLDDKCRALLFRALNVAVVDQVESSATTQTGSLVRRAVTRLMTPGTLLDEAVLDTTKGNFVCCVSYKLHRESGIKFGLAFADVGTGELRATERCGLDELHKCLSTFKPIELVLPSRYGSEFNEKSLTARQSDDHVEQELVTIAHRIGIQAVARRPHRDFKYEECVHELCRRFNVESVESLGCRGRDCIVSAVGALFTFIASTVEVDGFGEVPFSGLQLFYPEDSMQLDDTALRNLEIVDTMRSGSSGKSLLWAIDRTVTAMGARRVRNWLLSPLMDVTEIRRRQELVTFLARDHESRDKLRQLLKGTGDLERLAGRTGGNRASPRELQRLGLSLLKMTKVADALQDCANRVQEIGVEVSCQNYMLKFANDLMFEINHDNGSLRDLARTITAAVVENPPNSIVSGHFEEEYFADRTLKTDMVSTSPRIIQSGYDSLLDSLRDAQRDPLVALSDFELKEQKRTGITSLRVKKLRNSGYAIRVPRSVAERQLALEPSFFSKLEYDRTLSTKSEIRFKSERLRDLERVDNATAFSILRREYELFQVLRKDAGRFTHQIRRTAAVLAELDALLGFAQVAYEQSYVAPVLLEEGSRLIHIVDGRHPVVEQTMPHDKTFVPNTFTLGKDVDDQEGKNASIDFEEIEGDNICDLGVLCGPNASGKSCAMRLVGLIVILAQCGSHVPASSAYLGITDQVLTRVGAVDDLSLGQSTFQVEMAETAAIIASATSRSLVLLDEIGRGTAVADGISIAWAIAEYFAGSISGNADTDTGIRRRDVPRTLFVTHYHELNELAVLSNVSSLRMQVICRSEMDPSNGAKVISAPDDMICTHKIVPGASWESLGIATAERAGIPPSVVARAKEVLNVLKKPSQDLAHHLRTSICRLSAIETPNTLRRVLQTGNDPAHSVDHEVKVGKDCATAFNAGFEAGRRAALDELMEIVHNMQVCHQDLLANEQFRGKDIKSSL